MIKGRLERELVDHLSKFVDNRSKFVHSTFY
jgi:hypothetical protein